MRFVAFFYYFFIVNMDINKVMLIGRSTTDVEVKRIETTGSSVVNFTLATNRKYKNKDGQMVEESEYHRCVAYGNAADVIGKYVTKGKRMYVEGRLRTRKWEDTSGQTKYSTEIIVDNFIFLDSRPAGEVHDDASYSAPSSEEDLPF
jgi:single-strand DNA-binding protein